MLIGKQFIASVFRYIQVQNPHAILKREVSTSNTREEQIFNFLQSEVRVENTILLMITELCRGTLQEFLSYYQLTSRKKSFCLLHSRFTKSIVCTFSGTAILSQKKGLCEIIVLWTDYTKNIFMRYKRIISYSTK